MFTFEHIYRDVVINICIYVYIYIVYVCIYIYSIYVCIYISTYTQRKYIYIYIHILIFLPTVKLVTFNPLQQKSEQYCIIDGVDPIRHISLYQQSIITTMMHDNYHFQNDLTSNSSHLLLLMRLWVRLLGHTGLAWLMYASELGCRSTRRLALQSQLVCPTFGISTRRID